MRNILLSLLAALAGCLSAFAAADKKPGFVWHPDSGRIDAAVEGWTLPQTLSRLARVTGWQIFCEPGTEMKVNTAFKGLPPRDALPRILGDLSFAMVPRTNGPPQLFIYRTHIDSATDQVEARNDKEPGIIGNELIVALKAGSTNRLEEVARKFGGSVTGRIDSLNALRLTFPTDAAAEAARKELGALDDVASVENNLRFPEPEPGQQLASSPAQGLNLKPRVVGDKDRIIVGLIDTAVQPISPTYDAFMLKSIDVLPGNPDPREVSHGTAMAETILRGVSMVETKSDTTPVRILPVNVYGPDESTTSWDVARGINAALANGATIINMSLGSTEESPWLHTLIANATKQGAIFVGSAGNTPVTDPTYPAAYPEVLAVTAGNSRGELAPYANRGNFIDVMAPGSTIIRYGGQSYMVTGTSPAAAFVSGVAGAMRSVPGMTPDEIRARIQKQLGYKPGK